MSYDGWLRKQDYTVADVDQQTAAHFIARYHYARGCSNTASYRHGLFRRTDNLLVGVVMWMPPTKVAAQSVDPARWTRVLSLSRMAIAPGVPKGACSRLLGQSVQRIKRDGRFVSLVTYADEYMDHDGGVYLACGWQRIGRSGAYTKWLDPQTGRQVAQKATFNRVKSEMLRLGYVNVGVFGKVKFVLYPHKDSVSKVLRLCAAIEGRTHGRTDP